MKKLIICLLSLLIIPSSVLAYSNRIAISGETIGIEAHSDGVYIVGFYEVQDKNIGQLAGFQVGDIIKKIDDTSIQSIESLNQALQTEKEYEFEIQRGEKTKKISFTLIKENDILKSGLYVKDQINGIGTLSYIDPETKVYGALGHEILESSSLSKFQISSGNIYKAEVSTIKKSNRNESGEKNANIDYNEQLGNINSNEINGIFGIYDKTISNYEIIDIASTREIKKGPATLKTVIKDNQIEDFNINIISIDESSSNKNIFFEITDQSLLTKTGGIIQGMSGSPIIQDNKIIGVLNYVIVSDTKKGYGIFITKMLEEGDKILS